MIHQRRQHQPWKPRETALRIGELSTSERLGLPEFDLIVLLDASERQARKVIDTMMYRVSQELRQAKGQ